MLVFCQESIQVIDVNESIVVKGKVINDFKEPLAQASITIEGDTTHYFTNDEGEFSFSSPAFEKKYIAIQVQKESYHTKQISLYLNPNKNVYHLEDVVLENMQPSQIIDIPIVEMSENEMDGGGSSQAVSSLLTSTIDLFLQQTQFNLGAFSFSPRGYRNNENIVLFNGSVVNDLNTGYAPYSVWGGLNDVMRNNTTTYGLFENDNAVVGGGSIQSLNTFASNIRPQLNATYVNSNVNYSNTWRLSYASGLLKNGWSVAVALTKRYALPPIPGRLSFNSMPGTWGDAYSYFLSVDKHLKKHLLNLTVLGTPTQRASNSPTVVEAKELAGTHFYNPNWGYDNGDFRSAVVSNNHTPVITISDEWEINEKNTLKMNLWSMFGRGGKTSLDWYNTADPRPDYYRYLPSYYSSNPPLYQKIYENIKADPNLLQINWNNLYQANMTNTDVFGGMSATEKRSRYLIGENRQDPLVLRVSVLGNHIVGNHYTLNSGLNYTYSRTHYFKAVNDLLGGDYFVNLNQFGESTFPTDPNAGQVNLNNPNEIVRKGNIYNYNYAIHNQQANGWGQINAKYNHIDFFGGVDLGIASFYRYGYYKSGLFPENSFGRGKVHSYFNVIVKGGITYKINGKNYVMLNVYGGTQPPFSSQVYVSPRTRDNVLPNSKNATTFSAELGYFYRDNILKFQATGFFTQKNNLSNTRSYFDDNYNTFVNLSLYNIQQRSIGVEAAAQIKILPTLEVNLSATYGNYYYANRPKAMITIDNDNTQQIQKNQEVYMKNYKIPNTISEAYTAQLRYNSRKYWFVSLTGNVAGRLYYDIAPNTRTISVTGGMDPNSTVYKNAITQIATPYEFTLNAMAGYNWFLNTTFKIKSRQKFYINILASVNNLLNNKNIVAFGYEQLRYDFTVGDNNRFLPKSLYAYGINYQVTLSFRMQ